MRKRTISRLMKKAHKQARKLVPVIRRGGPLILEGTELLFPSVKLVRVAAKAHKILDY